MAAPTRPLTRTLRYLLLQVRDDGDPMRTQEIGCFARALHCSRTQIAVFDLLRGCPSLSQLTAVDAVLLGGSGDYSVAEGGAWLEPALDAMRELHALGKPTFATCWGFQAMAQALGGHVVTDLARAELGTLEVDLTIAGRADPVFGPLGDAGPTFAAQIGHQDIVERLPEGAALLALTERAPHAYTFAGRPIYCTQFHPELERATFLERVRNYPAYVTSITGLPYDQFEALHARESPHANRLLARFRDVVFG
jgi:GMP synthase (glutamine-hydrolysing)